MTSGPLYFGYSFRIMVLEQLFVEPDVFEARAVVDAVDHLGHPFHPWLVADGTTRVIEDRPGIVFGELAFDLPHQMPPLLGIGLDRLTVDQCIDLRIAVSSIVAHGAAGVIFVKTLIWIVEAIL